MALVAKIAGTQQVLARLAQAGLQVAARVERGLKTAGLFIQRESMKIVPVDLGNLRASAFTHAEGRGFDTVVEVGYTANYALYVHEDLNARHKKGKTAKYLERPIRENRTKVLRLIQGGGI